jgi:hypothetical protein
MTTGLEICLGICISVASIVASILVTGAVVIRIPADYFVREDRPLPLQGHSRWARIAARVGLNVAGYILIALGVLMSVPGVPGQGILTILLGVMLIDVPGKRRLEAALVRRSFVHQGMNRVRKRFNRPPIEVPSASAR